MSPWIIYALGVGRPLYPRNGDRRENGGIPLVLHVGVDALVILPVLRRQYPDERRSAILPTSVGILGSHVHRQSASIEDIDLSRGSYIHRRPPGP